MKRHFDDDLNELKSQLLKMGALAEKMIRTSVLALREKNLDYHSEIMRYENEVNNLHIEIDDRCMRLFALQTPVAVDLRSVIGALKINNDLERIGDQACNIIENTMELFKAPQSKVDGGVVRISEVVTQMLHDALRSYVDRDTTLAESVIARDDMVDAEHQDVFNTMVRQMSDGETPVQRGLDLILISKNLEKIGDHATNIAEDVIFMVKGKDIRHPR